MRNLNLIGLDTTDSLEVAVGLNKLLSNFQIYYQTLRGLQWNIKGNNFFELHLKFVELYIDAHEKIDLLAERILTLGQTPHHTFSDYLSNSIIKEGKNISNGQKGVEFIIESLKTLLTLERQTLIVANKLEDEGTISLLTDFINLQEKQVWMFNAWLQS